MKKNYITPFIGRKCMETSALLIASVNHVENEQAAEGSSGDAVNFGRGSFWDDTEK